MNLYSNERYRLQVGPSVRRETLGDSTYQIVSLATGIVEYEDFLYPRARFLVDRFAKDADMAEKVEGEDEFSTPPLGAIDTTSIN